MDSRLFQNGQSGVVSSLGRGVPSVLLMIGWLAFQAKAQTLNVPPRPAGAPTGSQAVTAMTPMSLAAREEWIFSQVLSGNVPDFLRTLVPINVSANIGGTNHTCTYYAAPDYLALGTDADYFLTPMTPLLAQRLCFALSCTLPTRKMVNQIWTNAAVKMPPQTIPPSGAMTTVPVFDDHNFMVRTQRNLTTNAFPLGALVSGNKKDVIISSKIYTNFSGPSKPVVIYGWHSQAGAPIQPLYNGHEETYADYSHGTRLVQNAVTLDGAPNTITNILTSAALAGVLSDEAAGEGTSAGVIRLPRYTVEPIVTLHPRSQRVLPGATVTFQVAAQSKFSAPLSYQWLRNGISIGSATNASLVLANVQAVDSAAYSVIISDVGGQATGRAAWLRVNTNPNPLFFAENFDLNVSSQWNLFWAATNGIADYTVDWSYLYTTVAYTFGGVSQPIPLAPNSAAGPGRALRFTVNNNDAVACIAAVNVYPKTAFFSGDYALKFDLWINYPGPAGGSPGSTEHAIFGINHLGTQANWAAPSAASSDGIWFGVAGEGGDTRDYRAYVGNLAGTQLDVTASSLSASNNSAGTYQTLFPGARFETAGAPGKNWVEVEVRQTNNWSYWLLDGVLVGQRTNSSAFKQGKIMLGFMDTFNSIASPAADAFMLVDNVRVEDLSGRVRFLSAAQTNGQVRLLFTGVPGLTYRLETSTNLALWSELAVVACTNSPVPYVDVSPAIPARFYRVRQ